MWEAISKNWGYLTTIGIMVAVGFGAGIWVKESLDALETMPGQVEDLSDRLRPLEGLPKSIERSRCILLAQNEISKNEVKIYAVDLEIATVREKSMIYMEKEKLTPQDERKLNELTRREQGLIQDRKTFERQRVKHIRSSAEC